MALRVQMAMSMKVNGTTGSEEEEEGITETEEGFHHGENYEKKNKDHSNQRRTWKTQEKQDHQDKH